MAATIKKKITAYSQDGWYYFYGPAARQVNKLVGVALTTQHKSGKKLDLAGFPINSGPDFIGQLLDAGAEIDIKPMSARGSVSKWRNPAINKEKLFHVYVQQKTGNTKPFYIGRFWAMSKPSALKQAKEFYKTDYGHDLNLLENWQVLSQPLRQSNGKGLRKKYANPAINWKASQVTYGKRHYAAEGRGWSLRIDPVFSFKTAKETFTGYRVSGNYHGNGWKVLSERFFSKIADAKKLAGSWLRKNEKGASVVKNPRARNTTIIKAKKIGKVIIRKRASVANPYAYQVQYQRPGEKVEFAGAYYTNSRQDALAQAEADLKRRGIWKPKTKLITGAVPLNSTAAKHKNSTDTPCFYCGGPGGQIPGWDHATSCHRYRKPPGRKVKTIGRKRKAPIKNPFYIFQGHVDGGDYYRVTDSRNSDFEEWPTLAAAKQFVEAEKKKAREWVYFSIKQKDGRGDYREVYKTETGGSRRNPGASKVRQIRETFTGRPSNRTANKYAPDGTPAELAKLGNLVSIKTEKGLIVPAGAGSVWLCSDSKGRFHICTDGSRLIDGPARSFGQILKIEYEAVKPHLGFNKPTIFYHKLAEEGGRHPELITDGKGGLKIKGGSYYLTAEGIRD